jgi:uncharacterized membrane protein YphA (DoxX/SURF4 family)
MSAVADRLSRLATPAVRWIALLGLCAAYLQGGRWLGALALSAFTVAASFMANRYWELGAAERFAAENAFYEHLGLAGGFLLVAWQDLRERAHRA